ncbi:Radical SAM domain protein [Niastella koreensis GR20-10]|uniref:Radical SAM domain protein n=2 Tax=Niastella koreensis TaxID=354356 RepID=G8TFZ8_NIAKG|nr:radical SAM protein [Niastella koreensis]AEW00597.1 Radical SAM domain protein [Niastella koreensis GR20-10]
MIINKLYHTYKRYRTLQTDVISSLPIAILMPHSACNCRCVMCDIWKDNKNLKQLTEQDIKGLLSTFKKLGTRVVVMSGGEALLNANFFRFCEILKKEGIAVTLLSTGIALEKKTDQLLEWVNDIIVSLDGDETLHDNIRQLPGAFQKMHRGVQLIKHIDPTFRITARTVIHRLNYKRWIPIVNSAMEMGLDQISFLPADVSSNAFNRSTAWDNDRQQEVLVHEADLPALQSAVHELITYHKTAIEERFIAEPAEKLQKIYGYYAAFYGKNPFPYKKCNAPWVSTVVEADGTVRPCFFHDAIGNIRQQSLDAIINSASAIAFRKNLDMDKNDTCMKCVCYLNLPPRMEI